ncbi:MAG: hypothetical protein ACR2KB_05230 [Chitinophagaceae bacterium]
MKKFLVIFAVAGALVALTMMLLKTDTMTTTINTDTTTMYPVNTDTTGLYSDTTIQR